LWIERHPTPLDGTSLAPRSHRRCLDRQHGWPSGRGTAGRVGAAVTNIRRAAERLHLSSLPDRVVQRLVDELDRVVEELILCCQSPQRLYVWERLVVERQPVKCEF